MTINTDLNRFIRGKFFSGVLTRETVEEMFGIECRRIAAKGHVQLKTLERQWPRIIPARVQFVVPGRAKGTVYNDWNRGQ